MKRLMSLVVAGGIAASLVMSAAGPASAAGTAKVWFAQGLATKSVDVCVDGTEIRSNLGYRQRFSTDLAIAVDTQAFAFVVYAANATTCGGAILASHTYTLAIDQNYTVVSGIGGAHLPRLFLFSNSLKNTPSHTARFSYRHAADVGAVNASLIGTKMWRNLSNGGSVTGTFAEGAYQLRTRAVGSPADLHPVRNLTLTARIAYQVYLVGDHANGYKLITIQQPVIRPVH
jgi:hypothetical protein